MSKNSLSSHYLLGVEMGLGEALILFDLCLVLIALALVLNVKSENLDVLKCGGWGVFIAPTTKMVVGRGCCRWAHRTVRCASHVTSSLGFDRWSSNRWDHQTVRWCTGQPLFTLWCAFWRCSDSACSVRALCTCQSTVEVDRCAWKSLLRWHTGQSGATPDSPVNYSGVAFPET
jgi:hypothetical protein